MIDRSNDLKSGSARARFFRSKEKLQMKGKKIVICVIALSALLCGCAAQKQGNSTDVPALAIELAPTAEPVAEPTTEPAETPEPADFDEVDEQAETDTDTGRHDGERFEETIMLEGMEETVRYEHVRNTAIGYEMDYDYESLVRMGDPDREIFLSIYEDLQNPWNYLEVTKIEKDFDSAVSSVSDELSKEYEIITEQGDLGGSATCTKLITTTAKSGAKDPGRLQTVYIIPAGRKSIVAAAHYTIESAEGFGSRFEQMMNTLTVIDGTK